jgi:hypothetical protein
LRWIESNQSKWDNNHEQRSRLTRNRTYVWVGRLGCSCFYLAIEIVWGASTYVHTLTRPHDDEDARTIQSKWRSHGQSIDCRERAFDHTGLLFELFRSDGDARLHASSIDPTRNKFEPTDH